MNCYLCGKTIPDEDVVPDQQYQICYECEIKAECDWQKGLSMLLQEFLEELVKIAENMKEREEDDVGG